MRALVVEDDDRVARGLVTALGNAGYSTHRAATAAEALTAPAVDIVLLDLGLPDGDGVDLLRRLRSRPQTAIIAVTARAEETDRVRGLRSGADDYVVKPFGVPELLARIDAVLRRTRSARRSADHDRSPIAIGDLTVDGASRQARLAGRPLPLTRKEFEVLELLADRTPTVVTRDTILDLVWEATWEASSRTLDTHIAALRRKLADTEVGHPVRIDTVRGIGYRLIEPSGSTTADPRPGPAVDSRRDTAAGTG